MSQQDRAAAIEAAAKRYQAYEQAEQLAWDTKQPRDVDRMYDWHQQQADMKLLAGYAVAALAQPADAVDWRAKYEAMKIAWNDVDAECRKVTTERDQLHSEVERLKAENVAIRHLMDCYNVGGWTDAISPMERALKAEAELAAIRSQEGSVGGECIECGAEDGGHMPKCSLDVSPTEPCPKHKWMGRAAGSIHPCPYCKPSAVDNHGFGHQGGE